MMQPTLERLAEQLSAARAGARPVARSELCTLDLGEAYAVQERVAAMTRQGGWRQIGWKVGLTSPAAMAAFAATEPMAGRLFDNGVLESGASLDPRQTCVPRIEGEILLEIGAAPPPGADADTLIGSLASVRAAFEVADSRIMDWPPSVAPAVADNACCGWLVMGPPLSPRAVDLAATAMTLSADGEIVSQGRGADCLGSPIESYRWFLDQARRQGWTVEPGQLLLTGALGPPVAMRPDTLYAVTIDGLGTVTLDFRAAGA